MDNANNLILQTTKEIFLNAVENGDLKTVLTLIEDAGDNAYALVSAQDNLRSTALMYAAENGHTEIVNALIKAAGDNASTLVSVTQPYVGYTTLMYAAETGNAEIVNALIKAAGDNASTLVSVAQKYTGHTALYYACRWQRNKEIAFALMDAMQSEEAVCALKTHPDIGPFAAQYIDAKYNLIFETFSNMPALTHEKGPSGLMLIYAGLKNEKQKRRSEEESAEEQTENLSKKPRI